MNDEEDEVLSPDGLGRINLPPPTPEALEAAAQDVLGPGADEGLLASGAKVFRGLGAPGSVFIQGAEEEAGTIVTAASRVLQDELMGEALKVRTSKIELARMDYIDPQKNEFIKLDQDE